VHVTDTPSGPIDVRIVFGSRLAGDSLTRDLSSRSKESMVFRSVTANEAIDDLLASPPRILVTALQLNGERHSGLRLVTQAAASCPRLLPIILGESSDRNDILASFRAGARGYVSMQDAGIDTVLKAIRCVHSGQIWASSEHLNYILDEFSVLKEQRHERPLLRNILSKREMEVADLIMVGKSNKEIAAHLIMSEHTVRNHLAKIYAKMGVDSRACLICRIYEEFSPAQDVISSPVPNVQAYTN